MISFFKFAETCSTIGNGLPVDYDNQMYVPDPSSTTFTNEDTITLGCTGTLVVQPSVTCTCDTTEAGMSEFACTPPNTVPSCVQPSK